MAQKLITRLGCFIAETVQSINDNFTELYNAGGGLPGGSDTQVQFNDAGDFGGADGLTYDKTAKSLAFASNIPAMTSPITIAGGDSGQGAAALIISNPIDDYVFVSLPATATDFEVGGNTWSIYTPLHNYYFGINAGTGLLLNGPTAITGDVSIIGSLITTTHTPSAANDTGIAGQFAWDASYIYICTATNTWKRVAIATWP